MRMIDMQKILLRCFAEGGSSGWEATCIDLDISVQGNSFEEVRAFLNDGIAMYFESVKSLPESERVELIFRKAPFMVRARHIVKHLMYYVFAKSPAKERHDFVSSGVCSA